MLSVVLFFIFFILLLLVIFYYYYYYYHYNTSQCTVTPKNIKEETKKENIKVSILSNYFNGKIESRVVNVIISNNEPYIYSPKNTCHVKQIIEDNNVSLLMYIKNENSYKQVLLYGKLEKIKELDNLVVYRFNTENKKISITRDINDYQITNYTYDNTFSNEIKVNSKQLSDIISYIKLH